MKAKWLLGLGVLALGACDSDDISDGGGDGVSRADVIEAYVDARDKALTLQAKIDAFVSAPSAGAFEAAKRAWLEARVPYGQSEAFRFAGGPIDDADGPEGQLNAWPMDEAYVDYVDGGADAGIVNDPTIDIDVGSLIGLNEGAMGDVTGIGGTFDEEKAISTGYHAIEFLLWGQDLDATGPGERPFTDYLTNGDATAPNGDRRGLYMQVVAQLIVSDLESLIAEWEPGGPYRAAFLALDEATSLTQILTGAGVLSKGELAAERMDVALETLDQEDEHSCFADNTHIDILMNATGIQNVYYGRYEWLDGPGVNDLVRAADPALADQIDAAFIASIEAINAIPVPFDQSIASMGSPAWSSVDAAVNALFDQGDLMVDAGLAIGLDNVSVELPE
jgi:putative iron-regulated protein